MELSCLFTTATGYIGPDPKSVERGDHICVLMGCQLPVVLREFGDKYIFVGDCQVLGDFTNGGFGLGFNGFGNSGWENWGSRHIESKHTRQQ